MQKGEHMGSSGVDRLHPGQVLRLVKHCADHPVADFLRDSPFLVLSLAVHLLALLLLAFLTTQQAPESQRVKKLVVENQNPSDEPVVEIEPARKEDPLAEAVSPGRPGRGRDREETPAGPTSEGPGPGPEPKVTPIHAPGLKNPVAPGDDRQFEEPLNPDDTTETLVPSNEDGIPSAVNHFAVVTINAMKQGPTLVVLLIDRSRSIIYGDLQDLIERMDHYFAAVDKNLPRQLRRNGRWVVASYGHSTRFRSRPSSDVAYVKQALRGVRVDSSGEENVVRAVETILDRYSEAEYENLLIAAMTDEAGDDTANTTRLERAIRTMYRRKVRFFVFGHEATFCARKKRVSLKLDPEKMRGEDRNAVRGFEGRVIHGWADGGPEAPRAELWWGDNWGRWRHWGAHLTNLPSGFPMYALNRMVLATGGTYFLIESDSNYDEEKLYSKYTPDICARYEYDRRMEENELRSALKDTWGQLGYFNLPRVHTRNSSIVSSLQVFGCFSCVT